MSDNATATPETPAAPATEAPATPQDQAPVDAAPPLEGAPAAEAPKAPEPAEDPKFASRFAALSRRERELQKRAETVKSEREALKKWQEFEELAKSDPYALAGKLGITYDAWTSKLLGESRDPDPAEIARKAAAEEIARIERERSESAAKSAAEQFEQQKTLYVDNATKLATQQASETPYASKIAKLNPAGFRYQVWDLVEGWYEQTGQLITLQDAVGKINEALAAEFAPTKRTEAPAPPADKAPRAGTTSKTLSSSTAGDAPAPTNKKPSVSREDSLAAATKLFQNLATKRVGA